MDTLKIEILNPKALELLKNLQDLKLIKVTEDPVSALKAYLAKMRKKEASALSLEEITQLVEEVRAERYGKR